jgi:hypothetical protein
MPMPALVSSLPMPSYDILTIYSIHVLYQILAKPTESSKLHDSFNSVI